MEVCPKCGGPTEEWAQEGRNGVPAIRCLRNGCVWFLKRDLKERQESVKGEAGCWDALWDLPENY